MVYMIRIRFVLIVTSLVLGALLVGCNVPIRQGGPTPVQDLAYTQAAQTIIADLTENAPKLPRQYLRWLQPPLRRLPKHSSQRTLPLLPIPQSPVQPHPQAPQQLSCRRLQQVYRCAHL